MAKIMDTHCHLMDEMYQEDLTEVVQRCYENKMEWMINVGFDRQSSLEAVDLAKTYHRMYATIGFHPDACNTESPDLLFLKELANDACVRAIGEIGLDYHYEETNRENQKKGFLAQVDLANELGLPVVIHSRDADGDMIPLLKELSFENGFVMHCFSSSPEIAKEILKLGGYISLAGTVTFKNAKNAVEVAKMVPLDRLLVETDAPYLTPEPNRGKRNEPWHVWDTARKVAEIRGVDWEELVEQLNQNGKRFYNIAE